MLEEDDDACWCLQTYVELNCTPFTTNYGNMDEKSTNAAIITKIFHRKVAEDVKLIRSSVTRLSDEDCKLDDDIIATLLSDISKRQGRHPWENVNGDEIVRRFRPQNSFVFTGEDGYDKAQTANCIIKVSPKNLGIRFLILQQCMSQYNSTFTNKSLYCITVMSDARRYEQERFSN